MKDTDEPLYPDVEVALAGEDGNAGAIMARVTKALKRAGYGPDVIQAYKDEAMSGDYNKLLSTTMKWISVI